MCVYGDLVWGVVMYHLLWNDPHYTDGSTRLSLRSFARTRPWSLGDAQSCL